MIFSSLGFLLFFPVVLAVYWVLPESKRWRLGFLTAASVVFYMAWSAKLVLLLLLSATSDYFLAGWIVATEDPVRRRRLLIASVCFNLGFLGIFKYSNFLLQSVAVGGRLLGAGLSMPRLDIVLPIGISFYTFESMSYTIDVYHRIVEPADGLLEYLFFVAYFPHQIAGPILRARDFLPQLKKLPVFSSRNFLEGLDLFLLGLTKKVLFADRLGLYADQIFRSPRLYDGVSTWAAVVAYAFQIYCDFSGYSDMARGIGKTFGFDIMINFRTPYLSANVGEFWTRWHVSLSTWLKDYLFTPLGGYREGRLRSYRNLFLTMFLGGLWHGASWTFVFWGVYHGVLLILRRVAEPFLGGGRRREGWARVPGAVLSRAFVFFLVCVGWVFFRAQTFADAFHMLGKMFGFLGGGERLVSHAALLLVAAMFAYDLAAYWCESRRLGVEEAFARVPDFAKAAVYACAIAAMLVFGPHEASPFVYFQF